MAEKVCIVGMGYVGLTLAVMVAESGASVVGVERQPDIVHRLLRGDAHFFESGLPSMLRRHLNKNLEITDIIPEIYPTYIVAVATPIDPATHRTDTTALLRVTGQVAEHIDRNSLFILRSTVPLGTTRNSVLPILRRHGWDGCLAYCPERTAEGKALQELKGLPQIVGGFDEQSQDRAAIFFSRITPTVVRVPSLEAAELIKLIDNSYRDVHFAYANELSMLAQKLGLDGTELIHAANHGYPRNNIPVPGYVGGACLSKDPYILLESASKLGCDLRLIRNARAINELLPSQTIDHVRELLFRAGKDLASVKVLVLGMAFKGKPETNDLRSSPALDVIGALRDGREQPAHLVAHDYVVAPEDLRAVNVEPCSLEEGFNEADVAIFMNNHLKYSDLDIERLAENMNRPAVIFDGWHHFDPKRMKQIDGIFYGGIGVG